MSLDLFRCVPPKAVTVIIHQSGGAFGPAGRSIACVVNNVGAEFSASTASTLAACIERTEIPFV